MGFLTVFSLITVVNGNPYEVSLIDMDRDEMLISTNNVYKHLDDFRLIDRNKNTELYYEQIDMKSNMLKRDRYKSIKKVSNMVKVYEDKIQQELLREALEKQNKKLKNDIRVLEQDIKNINKATSKNPEEELAAILLNPNLEGKTEERKLKESLMEMEFVLNNMEKEQMEEDKKVKMFNKRATEIEQSLMDMIVQIQEINDKSATTRLPYEDKNYIKGKTSDFNEAMRELNNGVLLVD